jgi:hypothetical protein
MISFFWSPSGCSFHDPKFLCFKSNPQSSDAPSFSAVTVFGSSVVACETLLCSSLARTHAKKEVETL